MIQLSVINTASDTFQNWIDKTNAVVNTIANSVITANTNANGAGTTGNAFVVGILGGTTLVANTLRGGNVQSSANLTISSNALFTGNLIMLGANLVLNTSSIAIGTSVLSGVALALGNSTINAVVNSTAIVLSPNLTITGTSLAFGNSSSNVVVNTTGMSISGVLQPTANTKASVALNGTLVGNASRINFSGAGVANVTATVDSGNSQINVIINSVVSLSGNAGGTNTNILFNDQGANIGGSNGFTFNKSSNIVFVGNTLIVGTTVVNNSVMFVGNSTINAVSNSSIDSFSNSTVSSSYGLGGYSVGANVLANVTTVMVGNSTVQSTINATSISSGTIVFSSAMSGGNVAISTSLISVGNSTINAVINSTALVIGASTVNNVGISVGANLVVNSTAFLFGNTTVSWSGNSTQTQVANSTVAATLSPSGLAIGSNVSVGIALITVGTSTVNTTAISAASYLGSGIATAAQYWANTAGKVITSDALNSSGAYTTLTDAASIVWDMSTGINFQVTLAGNRTIANPTNVVVGRSGVLRVIEDATGTRTFSYGANFVFDSDVAPVISTVANKENYLFYHCITATRILITLAAKGV